LLLLFLFFDSWFIQIYIAKDY